MMMTDGDHHHQQQQQSSASSRLDRVLAMSNNLIDETAPETQISKNLESIHEQSKKLGHKIASTTGRIAPEGTAVQQGELLLASKGVNVHRYKRLTKRIDLATTFEPLEPLAETDIQGYLKHEHNMIVLTAIEEEKKLTSNEFYGHYGDYMDMEWKKSKQNLIQMLKFHKSTLRGEGPQRESISRYRPQSEQHAYVPGRRGRSNMDSRMKEHAAVVYQLNQMKTRGEYVPAVYRFMQCAEAVQERDARKREVINSWDIVRHVINEPDMEKRGVLTKLDRQRQRNALIDESRRYLELQYSRFIQERVSMSPAGSELLRNFKNGSNIDGLKLVDAYIEMHRSMDLFDRLQMSSNKMPIWAQIYFCLRCGFVEEARSLIADFPDARPLLPCLDKQKQMLSEELKVLRDQIGKEQGHAKTDPFKSAVYIVLTREGKKEYPKEVFNTAEDFTWLKLSTIGDQLALEDLQKVITQPGAAHYEGRQGSLLYFKLLLLTLQFEEAVHYLCTRDVDGYQIEAVHFAIALHYYGLINLATNHTDPLLSSIDGDGKKLLNFYFLIRDYVKLFAHTDPRDAVSYVNLIQDSEVKLTYMRELVVQSKDPSTLVGYIDHDGRKRNGCCSELLDNKQMFELLYLSAQEYERVGRYAVAIDMYFMAEECSRTVLSDVGSSEEGFNILSKILKIASSELSQVLIEGTNRSEVIQMAQKVRIKFEDSTLKSTKLHETFIILLKLVAFFDQFRDRKWHESFATIDNLNLLPFKARDIDHQVVRFRQLDETIKRRFPDIILASFITIYNLYNATKMSQNPGMMAEWKERAQSVLTFCSFIQSHLSADVYQRLVRMDIDMN